VCRGSSLSLVERATYRVAISGLYDFKHRAFFPRLPGQRYTHQVKCCIQWSTPS
jgi:hypothetical protein